ncbi:substrate-binding periplasmic protein [Desulfomicrobium salsuginis]
MTRRRALLVLFVLLGSLLATPAAAANATDLHVVYLERPPYYWTENGQPRGFLLGLTRQILDRAGIPASFSQHPPNRIMEELRTDSGPTCSIGWFKTPERETFATFSLPIYRDQPLVLLTTTDKAHLFSRHTTLRDVLADRSLIMAQVASFSYGEAVDRMQKEILVRSLTVSSSQKVLPKLILQGRAAYMLVAPEEVPTLLRLAEVDAGRFTTLTMQDIPAGNLRYLIFTKSVPDSTLQRINAAIADLTDQDALGAPKP